MKYRHDVDGLENIILGESQTPEDIHILSESIHRTCPEQENPDREQIRSCLEGGVNAERLQTEHSLFVLGVMKIF